ncbi:MAG: acylneuraminate cytidylyltransferase family protein [Deltaproteobacteria bacterium]|nr:acylneuraminate cytidylyltransferase family protein [Deltaproteobacteria bacterium]
MYKGNKVLSVIPARGGSKGLPGKNIMELAGKPLIAHTIGHALSSNYIDRTIVSTESRLIADIAMRFGADAPFLRPEALAGDDTGTIEVMLHAIEWLEKNEVYGFDILVLLHATTPLRSVKDIDDSIEMLVDKGADNVFSVTEAHKNPYFNMVERSGDTVRLVKEAVLKTRQAAPEVYDMNSSIYVWWKQALKDKKAVFSGKTLVHVMPRERSVDIDDFFDFRIARMLFKENGL